MSSKKTPEPQDAQGYFDRGFVYLGKKERDKAIADYDKAIGLDPLSADAYAGRGLAFYGKGEMDNAIADFSKAIELDTEYSQAYLNRGLAYGNKGEWGKAIADFSKVIELGAKNANAYFGRGVAYGNKEEWDNAIADLGEAIELNPQDAKAYLNRGVAYGNKGEWGKAIADFSKAIELGAKNANAYFGRGVAYYIKEEWDNAIADLGEAIELNPQDADAYFTRGVIYLEKAERSKAFKDFVCAGKKESASKSEYTEVYVASIINDFANNGGDPAVIEKHAIIEIFFNILRITEKIQNALFHEPQKDKEVAHYTSLDTLKNLVSKEPGREIEKGRFRLYNSAYMNDPEEGRVFFDIMNKRAGERARRYLKEKIYGKDSDTSYRSPAYIGSFIPVGSEKPKDELPLWRTYGKQKGEEAAGSCLIFPEESFAKNHRPQIGNMRTASTDINLEEQDSKPPIYKIVYIDKKGRIADKKIAKKLREELDKLAKCLGKVEGIIKKIPDDTNNKLKQSKLTQLVRELLDSIRFLFKASHYTEENEVRVLQLYYPEENTEGESGGIKVDAEQTLPRFYLETSKNFCFSEVILGRQVRRFQEWKRWIKDRDSGLKVERSEIPYGNENA